MDAARTLTKDRIFLLTYLFWMCAGCLLIIPVMLTIMAGSGLFSSRYQGSGEFIEHALLPFFKQIVILIAVGLVSAILFWIGLRDREVVLMNDGTLRIRWGSRFPLTLQRINTALLTEFVIEKEARFALNPRVNGHYGVRTMPDRWRLTARMHNRRINLGSYTTENEACQAIAALQQKKLL